jgi:galactokinase
VPAADRVRAFAPGRINLIGDHTDYNGGLALPFATTLGVTVTATPTGRAVIDAVALDLDERDEFRLDEPIAAVPGWRAFVRGVAAELQRSGTPVAGARLEITGDVPRGGGLSSSAAVTVSLALAMIALSGAPLPPRARRAGFRIALARLCSRVENDWVGARTGLLDQLASLLGQAGQAVRIDFRSLEDVTVPLALGAHRLVTLDSGEPHDLAAADGYNRRRAECEEARERLGLVRLSDASLGEADMLPEPLRARVRHVLHENARVDRAVGALRAGDVGALGRLLDDSHASLRDQYEISTPAVEAAVGRLRDAGAIGARILGGGFGGNVLGLLPPGAQPPAGAVEVRPGPGAHML